MGKGDTGLTGFVHLKGEGSVFPSEASNEVTVFKACYRRNHNRSRAF